VVKTILRFVARSVVNAILVLVEQRETKRDSKPKDDKPS